MASPTPTKPPRPRRAVQLTIPPSAIPKPTSFLDLPREIRDLIYAHTLTDIPRWQKRHTPYCRFHSRCVSMIERPLVDAFQTKYNGDGFLKHISPLCPCGRRLGLGLLGANRLIRREATPIFWSNNTFLIQSSEGLIHGVRKVLSEEAIGFMRHLVLLGGDGEMDHMDFFHKIWDAVFQLTNLRTLEVGSKYFTMYGHLVRELPARLPHLETFSLGELSQRIYRWASVRVGGYEGDNVYHQAPAVWWHASRPVDLSTLAAIEDEEVLREAMQNATRSFRLNFCVLVGTALREECGLPPEWPTDDRDWEDERTKYPASRVAALADTPRLQMKLRDGTKCWIDLMGLPVSRRMRIAHEKLVQLNQWLRDNGREEHPEKRVHDAVGEALHRREDTTSGNKERWEKIHAECVDPSEPGSVDGSSDGKAPGDAEPGRMTLEERRQRNAERAEEEEKRIAEKKREARAALEREMAQMAEMRKAQRKRVVPTTRC